MERCFVIQPFDGGMFDDRYEDVVAPAIAAAGLEPYRVDRDPKVSIPIQDIESGIRNARICLAEITLDNPNVWFELGFAIASFKDVVLVCSDARATKFPFDVQHRSIIKYTTGSTRDFEQLKENITKRVLALLEKEQTIEAAAAASKLQKIQGLEQHEVVTLAAIGENIASITDIAPVYRIRQDMERAGFNNLATTIGLKSLSDHGLINQEKLEDEDGHSYAGYRFTEPGWQWMLSNKQEFVLKKPVRRRPPASAPFDDDIPF
ncbi:hypothetical protein [Thermomonas brevis]